jgi:hypothetical protein
VPLSFLQEQYLAHHQKGQTLGGVNSLIALRFVGADFSRDAFQDAVNDVVAATELYRTEYAPADTGDSSGNAWCAEGSTSRFAASVAPHREVPVRHQSLEGQSSDTLEGLVVGRFAEGVAAPFDLSHAPMMRAEIIRCAADDHRCGVVLPYLITDGWSQALLTGHLLRAYAQRMRGTAEPVGATAGPEYADFAQWQWERWLSDGYRESMAYWRDQWLLDASPAAALPFKRPSLSAENAPAGSIDTTLPPQLLRSIRRFSSRYRYSVYVLVQTAFRLAAASFNADYSTAVWSNYANRLRPELEGMLGWFSHIYVVPVRLQPDAPLFEALDRVRQRIAAGMMHDDVPTGLLKQHLSAAGEWPPAVVQATELSCDIIRMSSAQECAGLTVLPQVVRYPKFVAMLNLLIVEWPDALGLSLRYPVARYRAGDVDALLRRLVTALTILVEQPETAVSTATGLLQVGGGPEKRND